MSEYRDCPTCRHRLKGPDEPPCDSCDTIEENTQSNWTSMEDL